MAIKKMICLDMDGTLCDFYGYPNWLSYLEAETLEPYLYAKPLLDMDKLREMLSQLSAQGWEIRIISWLSKKSTEQYKRAVRIAKRLWLNCYKLPLDAIHLVAYGTTKADCVRGIADYAILIDDDEKVRKGWHLGDTIDPTTTDLLEALKGLLK